MLGRIGFTACALMLLAVTSVSAQQVITGTVVRIDQPSSVVILDNGQMYQVTPQTVFLLNNQPTNFSAIAPGAPVVVQYGQPVMYRDGRYVVMMQPAPSAPNSPYEISGVVRWVGSSEPGRSSLTLDDGRHIWIDESTQVTASGSPVMMSTLRPGTFVVIRSTKPMAIRKNNAIYVPVAAASTVSGTVARFDQPNLIVLSDGRVIPANANTLVIVDNRSVPVTTLQPGTPVVIYQNGQVVEYPAALPR